MLKILTLPLGSLRTNCYLVWCSQTNKAIIIDPADSGETISQKILDLKITPLSIILTHGHFDHCLACLELKLSFNLPLLLHQKDLFLYQKTPSSAQYWLKRSVDPVPPPDQFISQSSQIKLGSKTLKVIETPGHTPGSICLYHHSSLSPTLFSGDTLFQNALGRTDFSYSNPQHLKLSLSKLLHLPSQTRVLPGHGPSTTIKAEKQNHHYQ